MYNNSTISDEVVKSVYWLLSIALSTNVCVFMSIVMSITKVALVTIHVK